MSRVSALRFFSLLSLALLAACRDPAPSPAPAGPSSPAERPLALTPGAKVEATLAGGESHAYRLDLPPGHFADLAVDQRGIDVVLRLTGPDGRAFPEVDSPNGERGPEPLPLLGAAGPQRLEVRSPDPQAQAGRYAVLVRAVRPATDRDRARVETEREFARAEGLRRQGDGASLQAAAAASERCVARFRALGEPRRAADALYALGTARIRLSQSSGGNPWAALAAYQNALALARESGYDLGEAQALLNLGGLEASLGRAEKALASYDQALILWRKLGLRVDQAKTLINRGELFADLGKTERALDDFNEAVLLLAGRPEIAEALRSRGNLLRRAGRRAAAARNLEQALLFQRRSGNRRGEAAALNDLGLLHQAIGQKDAARREFEAAVAVFGELGDPLNQALALINLGRLRAGMGDVSGAEAAFRRALPSFVSAGHRKGEAAALLGLAQVLRARGDLEGALRQAEAGLALVESLRTEPGSHTLRTAFFAPYQDAFAYPVVTAMELHRREPAAGHDARAFEASERARARSLLDALAEAGTGQPVSPELRARVTAAEQRRLGLVAAGAPAPQVEAAERDLRRSLGDLERAEAESRQAAPLAGFQPLSLGQVRHTLDAGTVLLEYALGENRSFLWVVTSQGLHSYELPARKVLEEAARRTHTILAESRRTAFRSRAAAVLRETSRLLLAPAADRLSGRRLVVVPDGALHLIPFGALAAPGSPEGEPLLARWEVVTVPSASSLAAIRKRAAGRQPAPAVIAVLADPVFDAADPRVTGRDGAPAGSTPQTRSAKGPFRRLFDRLPSSQDEARAVLSLAPPGERLVALGFAARRELVTGGGLERFRIVHFATHGVVDMEHPELSGIALSMVDERGRPQDGFLRAYEIYRLRLPADLVVLSACETALGREVRGEGVVGLTRAFFHAGARRVLVTLWPVEDRATAELMREFYVGLSQSLPPAEALRRAQDALRHQPGRQAPHYWAGFVLQGDWR